MMQDVSSNITSITVSPIDKEKVVSATSTLSVGSMAVGFHVLTSTYMDTASKPEHDGLEVTSTTDGSSDFTESDSDVDADSPRMLHKGGSPRSARVAGQRG